MFQRVMSGEVHPQVLADLVECTVENVYGRMREERKRLASEHFPQDVDSLKKGEVRSDMDFDPGGALPVITLPNPADMMKAWHNFDFNTMVVYGILQLESVKQSSMRRGDTQKMMRAMRVQIDYYKLAHSMGLIVTKDQEAKLNSLLGQIDHITQFVHVMDASQFPGLKAAWAIWNKEHLQITEATFTDLGSEEGATVE